MIDKNNLRIEDLPASVFLQIPATPAIQKIKNKNIPREKNSDPTNPKILYVVSSIFLV